MKATVWQRLDILLRNMTPVLVTLCMVVLGVVPLRLPGASFIVPTLALMAVYYWSLHRTDLLPATAVFVIGFFQDILTGVPMGLNAFILLGVFGICVTQRRFFYNKSFAVVWWGFMVVAAAALLVEWVLMSIYLEALISLKPVIFKYLATVALYPPVAWLFVIVQRSLPQEVE
jgi:rod shape-determining protein MreD